MDDYFVIGMAVILGLTVLLSYLQRKQVAVIQKMDEELHKKFMELMEDMEKENEETRRLIIQAINQNVELKKKKESTISN